MSLARPFVLDPPRAGIDRVDGILILDVDGVLNILGKEVDRASLPIVQGNSGRPLPIRMVDDKILDVLEEIVRRPGIWLGWLTTWGFGVVKLETLLGGRLSGGFIVSERPSGEYSQAKWKLEAASQLANKYPTAAIAWADDAAITPAMLLTEPQLLANGVLVSPLPEKGLTIAPASRIATHLNGVR
jgi:hypothetical protein